MSKVKIRTQDNAGWVCVCDNCYKAEFISEADGIKWPEGWVKATFEIENGDPSVIFGDFCCVQCSTKFIEKNTI